MSVCTCGAVKDWACEVHGDPVTVSQEWLDDLQRALEAAQRERDTLKRQLADEHEVGTLAHARQHLSCGQVIASKESDLAQARARLDSIRALHQPITDGENAGFCDGCDWGWPCPTTQALDTAQAAGGEEAHDPSARTD